MDRKNLVREPETDDIKPKDSKKHSRSKPEKSKVPAVTRAIAILRLLANSDIPLGVNKIAHELDLIPSTVLHILRVLIAERFVMFDENTKRYELDMGVLSIANSVLQHNRFIQVIQPSLHRLADNLGMTILAVKTVGLDHMTVVSMVSSRSPVRLHADLGTRFPSLISATGRCVAAFNHYKKNDLKQRFNKLRWDNPMSFGEWWDQVQQTRQDGYGFDDGAFMAGISVVAVPVFEEGSMTYSIVAIGLHQQFTNMGISSVATEMRNAIIESGFESISPLEKY